MPFEAPADLVSDLAAPWTAYERRAWVPPRRAIPSEWAEANRVLGRGQSARTGRWRNENAPYGVGIMDACTIPGVEEITVQKAAQIGVSEFVRNVLGCFAENDPDPALITLPNKEKGEEIVSERLIPLFRDTPCLAALA